MELPATSRRASKGLAIVAQITVFLVPLLMHPWGQSLCGRIKDVALWLSAAVAGCLLLIVYSSASPTEWASKRLTRPALLWLGVTALSVITAASRGPALWGAIGLIPYIVLGLSIAATARRPRARTRLMLTWVASASLVSLYAICQHYGMSIIAWPTWEPLLRASGTIGAPTYLGSFLAMAVPFAAPICRFRRPPWWLFLGIILILAALAVTYSRGPWAAAVAGLAVTLYALPRAAKNRLPRWYRGGWFAALLLLPVTYLSGHWSLAVVGCAAAVGLAGWVWSCTEDRRFVRAVVAGLAAAAILVVVDTRRPLTMAADRLTDAGSLQNDSLSSRRGLWRDATRMIMHRPWLGWGPDGFRVGASSLAHDNAAFSMTLLYPHQTPHSEWYTAAVNGGLAGLVAWMAFLLAMMSVVADQTRTARRADAASRLQQRRGAVCAAVYGALVAFVVQGFVTPLAPTTAMGLAFCWGMAAGAGPATRRRCRLSRRLGMGLAPAWVAGCLSVAAMIFMADTLAGAAARALKARWYEQALSASSAAARWNPLDLDYTRAWGEAALRTAKEASPELRAAAAQQARVAYAANLRREPRNGIWHAGLAQSLSFLDPVEAVRYGEKGVELSPLSAMAWWSLSRAYRASGDLAQEKETLILATAVGPVSPDSFVRLAEIFRSEGRLNASESLLIYAADIWRHDESLAPWRGRAETLADGSP